MISFFLIIGSLAAVISLILWQMRLMKTKHPNGELLAKAFKMAAGDNS
jgi:hypothetical protein